MPKNGRLEIAAAGMLLACSPFSLRAQQLPATAPTGVIAAEGVDAVAALVPPPTRHPNPPHVSCPGDQLTIKADYSLLSSVLDAVHACIGVNIALPEGFVDGPVFFELGPGRTREVLNSLLNASDLDFVILLSPTAPEKVVTVELMARSTGLRDANAPGAATSGPMTPARLAWLAARNLGRGVPPAEGSTVEPLSNDVGAAGSASADHAEASPAVSTSPPETRPAAADADADAASNPTASDNTAASSRDAVTTTAETPTAAAPTDPNAVTPADQELQQKITNMQQLFEQRRKLNSTPATTPDSNAASATNPS
jgi:predicted kinase